MNLKFFDFILISTLTLFFSCSPEKKENNVKADETKHNELISSNSNNTNLNQNMKQNELYEFIKIYNNLKLDLPKVIFVENWNKWVIKSDIPISAFNTYNDYVAEIMEETEVDIELQNIIITNNGTGGGKKIIQFTVLKSDNITTNCLLIQKDISPEEIEIKALTIDFNKNNGNLTSNQIFENLDFSPFFEKREDTDILIKYDILLLDYSYDLTKKLLIVTTKKNYLFDCSKNINELKVELPDIPIVCELLKKQKKQEVSYKYQKESGKFILIN